MLSAGFCCFPRGACDDASLLLARYLGEQGHGTFQRISGKAGDQTHVWLERDDWIIDITGDQFTDWPHGKVYVGQDRSWFERFGGVETGVADYTAVEGSNGAELARSYQMILKA